jgi:uncharacterized membrane protein YgaE (UPF0421/DUF939 family)
MRKSLVTPVRGAWRRVASAGWTLVETPVAAGLAWYIAHTLLGHPQPFFAPTAAALSLSATRVLRGQRALQMIVGVTLGICIGAAVKVVAGPAPAGSGAVAIGVAVLIALVAALALGSGFFGQGFLFVNQTATSAILMMAVAGAATGTQRLLDALIGGGVTLLIAVVLFPTAPLPLIRKAARQVFATLRDTVAHLGELADTGRAADPAWVLAAGQRIHRQLAGLREAQSTARQIAGLAPRRWPDRVRVRRVGEQTAPIDLLAASVLSLVHAAAAAPDAREPLPPALREALQELTSAFAVLGEAGHPDTRRAVARAARARGLAAGAAKTDGRHAQLVGELIEACADDTLRLTGGFGSGGRDPATPPVPPPSKDPTGKSTFG